MNNRKRYAMCAQELIQSYEENEHLRDIITDLALDRDKAEAEVERLWVENAAMRAQLRLPRASLEEKS